MIVSEEEAKTKRCQQSFGDRRTSLDARTVAMASPYGSSYEVPTSPTHCIGSACMAWCWKAWINSKTPDVTFFDRRAAQNYNYYDGEAVRVGFCGLVKGEC